MSMYSVVKAGLFTGTQYARLTQDIALHHQGQAESFLLTEDPIEVPPKPGEVPEEPVFRKPTPEELATAETANNVAEMTAANIDVYTIATANWLSVAKGDNTLQDAIEKKIDEITGNDPEKLNDMIAAIAGGPVG